MVRALLDTLSQELQALVEHPNGTKTNPAATCKELLLAHPNLPDGTGVHMGSPPVLDLEPDSPPRAGTARGGLSGSGSNTGGTWSALWN